MEIPEAGAIYIVHTSQMRDYVRHMIGGLRGPEVFRKTDVVMITSRLDVPRELAGRHKRVIIDHAFGPADLRGYLGDWVRAWYHERP
jgi:hypothetical protein